MKTYNLQNFTGGWFIGNFDPSLLKTSAFEVSIKRYKKGDVDAMHYHKIATEFTVIVSGEASMNGTRLVEGDIVIIDINESVRFEAIEDTTTCVVKTPSVKNDKYIT